MTKIEELEAKVKDLQEEIEKLKKEEAKELTWPKYGDTYWSINATGSISSDTWRGYHSDRGCLSIGNVFHSEEEAEFAWERLKVIAELKKFAEPEDMTWDRINFHYVLEYDYNTETIYIDWYGVYRNSGIHFESEEKALEAIKAVGSHRIIKYYLGVRE